MRCFVPLRRQPSPSRAAVELQGEGVAAGPRLGQGEGDVRAAGEEVRQHRLARRAGPVAHQRAGAVGPGEHPLGPAQAVAVDLLLHVEGVNQPQAEAVRRGQVGAVEAGPRRGLLHAALEPDHGVAQPPVGLEDEGGVADLGLDLLDDRQRLVDQEGAHPLERGLADRRRPVAGRGLQRAHAVTTIVPAGPPVRRPDARAGHPPGRQPGLQRLRRRGRDRQQQAAAGLRVEEQLGQVGRDRRRDLGEPLGEGPVAGRPAGRDPGRRQLAGARQERDRPGVDLRRHPAGRGQLGQVAEEPEAGDVGRAAHPRLARRRGGRRVRGQHRRRRRVHRRGVAAAVHPRGRDHADAQGLGQHERVAGPPGGVGEQVIGVGRPDRGEPVLRLGVVDRVAAQHRAAVGHRRLGAAAHDRGEVVRVAVGRVRGHRQRERRRRAHRVQVAERVGRRDRAEGRRVVNDRREEVNRRDHRQVVAHQVGGRVVGALEAHQHARVGRRRRHQGERLGEGRLAELAAAPAPAGHGREARHASLLSLARTLRAPTFGG